MARPGTNTTLYSPASVGSGTATALRNAWAAAGAALGQWTVGAMETFNPGSSERNFWVLSAGGIEILFNMNNGDPFHHSTVHSSYYASYNVQRNLYMSLAPEGGFLAAFAAGEDPLNSSFWTHITSTQGLASPTIMIASTQMQNGFVTPKCYLVTDDTTNMLMVAVGDRNVDDRYECFIIADDLFSNDGIHAADQIRPEGLLAFYNQDSASVPNENPYFTFFNQSDDAIISISGDVVQHEQQNPYDDLAGAAMTLANSVPMGRWVVWDTNKIYAKVNQNYLRTTPYNDPSSWKDINEPDANYGFVRMYNRTYIPWEVGYANPT